MTRGAEEGQAPLGEMARRPCHFFRRR